MCLSTVYKQTKEPGSIVMSNVQRIEDRGGTILLTDIMERQTAVEGRIAVADLVEGYVGIEPMAS